MSNFIDITGQKFNKLTALKYLGKSKWECICDCGNKVIVTGTSLRNGTTKSCGCFKSKVIDETGNRYGKLTVIKRVGSNKYKQAIWLCKCDCGNEVVREGRQLRRGNENQSCGCFKGPKTFEAAGGINEIGNRYGKLIVIERAGTNKKGNALWKCRCDCGNEIIASGVRLRYELKSCGCLIGKNNVQLIPSGEKFGLLTVLKREGSKNNRATYKCKCECGNEIIVDSNKLKTGNTVSCGCLKKSHGELKIEQLLKDNNINFTAEYLNSNCVSNLKGYLRFDFFVNNEYLIEFDGIQHFISVGGWFDEDFLKNQQQRDEIKNQWCKDNNIPLIRIPYWHLQDLTIDDLRPETSQFLI